MNYYYFIIDLILIRIIINNNEYLNLKILILLKKIMPP